MVGRGSCVEGGGPSCDEEEARVVAEAHLDFVEVAAVDEVVFDGFEDECGPDAGGIGEAEVAADYDAFPPAPGWFQVEPSPLEAGFFVVRVAVARPPAAVEVPGWFQFRVVVSAWFPPIVAASFSIE